MNVSFHCYLSIPIIGHSWNMSEVLYISLLWFLWTGATSCGLDWLVVGLLHSFLYRRCTTTPPHQVDVSGAWACCTRFMRQFVPTTRRLAEQDSREVSLTAVILYSPLSASSVLLIVSEYVSPSDDIVNLSLDDSSAPSLYLHTTQDHTRHVPNRLYPYHRYLDI